MPKFTINLALALLRFALNLIPKVARVIYTIIDLVDDGCLNSSAPRPEWLRSLSSVLDSLSAVGSTLTQVESQIDSDV